MGFVQRISLVFCIALSFSVSVHAATRQMENLGRGLVASNTGNGILLSWRLLGTENPGTEFNVYRDNEKIVTIKGTEATNYLDASGTVSSNYSVTPVLNGTEGEKSAPVLFFKDYHRDSNSKINFPYMGIRLDKPLDQTMPGGEVCSYSPNDMSVGDLDGDGEYELVVKWDPSNSKDNSQAGYTGSVIIDAYKLSGKKLWRIDLGKNIRAGAHYTQFLVFDFNGDGFAEVVAKTSDGTVDGKGVVIGDGSKDYRTESGTIMSGNEYLTVFDGKTGAAITTINYWPKRDITNKWGDTYGNRSERMLAAVAYLDGKKPSIIMCRGYYTNAYVAAYDFDGKNLTERWLYKAETAGSGLYGEGFHNLSVGDVDGDGIDEIIYGSSALNADGTLKYRTGFGHGDAMHLSDMDPDRAGLEVYAVHEEKTNKYSEEFRTSNGSVVWGTLQSSLNDGTGVDNGRGLAADLDSTNRGFELWSGTSGGLRTVSGALFDAANPSVNFRLYFDGDLQDELLDATGSGGSGGKIEKWNSSKKYIERYFSFYNVNGSTLNNYTKANPCLSADLVGDWREEFISRSSTDPSLVTIFTTPVTTPHRLYTLMHDSHYRLSVAWQNVGYNQPPHVGYYLPDMVKSLAKPDIYVVEAEIPGPTLTKNGAGSSSQSIVLGNSLVDFSYVYEYCTSVEVTGLPKGVTATINTNEQRVSISGTPSEEGTFSFVVKTVGGTGDAAIKKGTIAVANASEIMPEPEPPLVGDSSDYRSVVDASIPEEGLGWTENTNAGFVVNGYFNFTNEETSFGTWNLYSEKASEAYVIIRFANGGANARSMKLMLNGVEIGVVEMPSTGNWTTWETVSQKISLVKGLNTLSLYSTTAEGGANIDVFYFNIEGVYSYSEYETGIQFKYADNGFKFNSVTSSFYSPKSGFTEFYFYDVRGKMKFGYSKMVSAGTTILEFDKEFLPSGSYIVRIRQNGLWVHQSHFFKVNQ